VTKKAALLRLVFASCAILVSIGMSFRHIPSLEDPNDTGRYVANQIQACELPFSGSSSLNHDSSLVLHSAYENLTAAGDRSLTLSMRIWDWLMRPACWGGSPRFFLFYAAMAFPMALLLFANWEHESTLILAAGMLFSTVGFEFVNNVLRQGVGLAFLLGGFYFEKRLPKFLSLAIAVLVHDSNLIFAPLAILLAYSTGGPKKRKILVWAIPVLSIAGYLISLRLLANYGDALKAINAYTETYSEKPTIFFLLFMTCPMALVFLVRFLDGRSKPTSDEWIVFCYTSVILVLTIALFPYITYRFAMTGVVLQVFMAMRSPNLSVRSGTCIAGGLIAHFMVYALVSKSVLLLFYG
jgi:hypothetical protein